MAATATATETVTVPVPEELQKLNLKFEALNARVGKLTFQLEEERGTLAAVTGQYSGACRDLAAGKDSDPEAYKREMERRSSKIIGIESLLSDLTKELEPVVKEREMRQLEFTRSQERLKEMELLHLQREKEAVCDSTLRAHQEALAAASLVTRELDQHRKKCRLREEELRKFSR